MQYKEQREAFDVLERELTKVNKSLSAQSKVEVGLEEKQKHVKAKEKKLQKSITDVSFFRASIECTCSSCVGL